MSVVDELRVVWTSHFKKDYKLAQRRHYDIAELKRIIRLLAQRQPLPEQNKDHPLHNNWEGFRGKTALAEMSKEGAALDMILAIGMRIRSDVATVNTRR